MRVLPAHWGSIRKMKPRRRLAVVGFNLLLFFALLELAGLVDHFTKTGRLYYASRPRAEPLPDVPEIGHQTDAHRLHPYFGFVVAPSRLVGGTLTNNYGFYSRHDYPYQPRSPDELVVGLFGGSVAAKLELFERERGLLRERLADVFGRDRSDVTVLSFAQGAFKQPQQLLIYTYFRSLGQRFDVVINIDGFNEIAMAAGNVRTGAAVDMPSMSHLASLQHLAGTIFPDHAETGYLEAMLCVRESYGKYSSMHNRTWSRDAWELRFAAGFFLDRKMTKIYRTRYRTDLLAYQELRASRSDESWLYVNPLLSSGSEAADGLAAAVDLWAQASSMMHAMQSRAGGSYFHVVQPNQYHPTQRDYGARERSVAFDEQSPYADPIRQGYPRLRQEFVRLKASGVPAHDLSELFDDLEAEAYSDNCCHYTDAGQEALATAIADGVSSTVWKNRRTISPKTTPSSEYLR